ncbi:HAMP domain-containing sensor histidine kinase [Poseidonibacter sp. 1_MG-2023]|uniref:sensor histidine kinase n=1 Tax=Poseidonibacter TaxID=2321187 RepID=UPI0026E43499|nr:MULTISPECIES: HAMP domain-containing sensor histidine kinase [Poseidonibacter]MDO6828560.1 HAMP domain-containing sensor histidine kinase [Poseidonibacter sp. 1_MG-2023]
MDIKLIYDLSTTLAYGITFGILIMTIMYTLVRYIYSKEIFYISYCIMQAFSLLFIISYSKMFDISHLIEQIAILGASLFSIVFAVSFYEGKFFPKISNYKELIINTILFNIVVLTAFYHYMLFEYLPYTIIYAILFISIVFNLRQGFKPTVIYVVGWSLLCFVLFVMDFKTLYIQKGYMDLVLLAFTIEAILFTLSVGYKYNNLQIQSNSYEDMLLQQSRLAKSGEMIGNITHQFRQPLNNLSYILINIKKRFENKKLDEVYLDKKINQANIQLDFLSKTIDDFKDFYAPSKQKEIFSVKEAIDSCLTILSADFKKHNIALEFVFNTNENIKIYGVKNELSQVILALLSNSNDALTSVENPYIRIEVTSSDAEVIIKIQDNAGGIKEKNIEKVFEAYFSTKEQGSGIGLYLVQLIVEESFEGKIELVNKKEGVAFTLFFEKSFD